MPELPDITVYCEALEQRIAGRVLERVRIQTPFLLRSVRPEPRAAEGRVVTGVRRLGKRIAIGVEGGVWLVVHLMIAGRLHWRRPGAALGGRQSLMALDFAEGSVTLTEAGRERRASLHVVEGEAGLAALDPGGLDVFAATVEEFGAALRRENHTLKRALTDPRLLDGIGNAYSDEILHAARLSPVTLTQRLGAEEMARLWEASRAVLARWIALLREEARGGFPEKVTAFRAEMAVHGKYGAACPVCGAPVQRIRYANNETNYCAGCQTGGRVLADRALSRLLGADFPRTLEEWEGRLRKQGA